VNGPGCDKVVSAICTPGVWPSRPLDSQPPEQRVMAALPRLEREFQGCFGRTAGVAGTPSEKGESS
jgi:hypothetical protein